MGERVDLEALEASYEAARGAAWAGNVKRAIDLAQFAIPALITELRVARQVVEDARMLAEGVRSGLSPFTELARLLVAIEAYDQTTGRGE